jgi:hypothetical protein
MSRFGPGGCPVVLWVTDDYITHNLQVLRAATGEKVRLSQVRGGDPMCKPQGVQIALIDSYKSWKHFQDVLQWQSEGKKYSRYSDWQRAVRPRGRSSSPGRVENFRFSASSTPTLGPNQPLINGVLRALSLGVKRKGSEADNVPPTTAKVKKTWNYTSTPSTPSWCA